MCQQDVVLNTTTGKADGTLDFRLRGGALDCSPQPYSGDVARQSRLALRNRTVQLRSGRVSAKPPPQKTDPRLLTGGVRAKQRR